MSIQRKASRQAKSAGVGADAARRARRMARERSVLASFVQVYCRHHHGGGELCGECSDLLDYALGRLERCPYDPKPKCKKCPTHCYKPDYRQRIKQVMKFSGIYFVKRGRLDWLVRYFMI